MGRPGLALRGFMLAAVAVSVFACEAPDDRAPGEDPRAPAEPPDSAALVGLWGDPPVGAVRRLADLPVQVVGDGTDAGEAEFHEIAGAVVLSPDAIAVGDRSASRVVAVDPRGRVAWRQGGRGMGPGEYREITAISPHPSGGVAVLDADAARLTVVSPGGELVETIPLPQEARGRLLAPVWLADGGAVIGIDGADPPPAVRDTLYRRSLTLIRLSADGSAHDTLATAAGRQQYRTRVLGLPSVAALPFPRDQGYGAAGDLLVVGPDDSTRIVVTDAGGTTLQHIVANLRGTPFSDADRRAFRERNARVAEGLSGRMRAAFDTVQSRMPLPEMRPLAGPIQVDQSGRIWVPEAHDARGEPELWWVLDVEGHVREVWSFDPGTSFLAANGELIVTRTRDELGVELVQVHERSPRATAPPPASRRGRDSIPRGLPGAGR